MTDLNVVFAVYDKTMSGKGIKPISLHRSEQGAKDVVAAKQATLSEHARKLVFYEPFPVSA